PGTTSKGSGSPASWAVKAHSVAEACGSASTTVTDPCRARAVATKMEVTVLDTPPLGFKTVMTVLIPSTIPPDPHNTTWGSGGLAKLCTTERLDMQTYRPKPTGLCDADGRLYRRAYNLNTIFVGLEPSASTKRANRLMALLPD